MGYVEDVCEFCEGVGEDEGVEYLMSCFEFV